MSGKVFLDSNILIYAYSNSEQAKQTIARFLIEENNSFISTQVLQELCNTITRKFKFSYSDATLAVTESCENNILHINTEETIILACSIAERYKYSFYDSTIIAAALQTDCVTLYSEDMHHNHVVDGTLTIMNPFI